MNTFLRWTKPGLPPYTGLLLGEEKSMADGSKLFKVALFGYKKTELWSEKDCKEYIPSPFMLEQLNQWLAMIS